jgi:hypothetical protein
LTQLAAVAQTLNQYILPIFAGSGIQPVYVFDGKAVQGFALALNQTLNRTLNPER